MDEEFSLGTSLGFGGCETILPVNGCVIPVRCQSVPFSMAAQENHQNLFNTHSPAPCPGHALDQLNRKHCCCTLYHASPVQGACREKCDAQRSGAPHRGTQAGCTPLPVDPNHSPAGEAETVWEANTQPQRRRQYVPAKVGCSPRL